MKNTHTQTSTGQLSGWRSRIALAAIALLAAFAGIQVGHAQTILIPYNATWKYTPNNVDLMQAWRDLAYDDSGWSNGTGPLGFPVGESLSTGLLVGSGLSITTVIPQFSPTDASRVRTYYFRISFVFTSSPANVTLISTNLIDDAAVFYLNGVEIGRPGFNAGTVVTHASEGNRAAADVIDYGYDVFTNNAPTPLIQGTNVLAVEVHQTGASSSDLVFAHRMLALIPTPVAITLQPTNITVAENRVINLSVGASGYPPPAYQWYRGTNPPALIPDATNAIYTITNTSVADTGDYFVIVTNILNSVTSRVARLNVVQDTNGPVLLSIKTDDTFQRIILNWDEVISQGPAIESGSYFLTDPQGNQIDITAVDYNGTNVVLHVAAPMQKGTNYAIEIDYQTDLVGNPTKPVGMPQLDANGIVAVVRTWVVTPGFTLFQAYLNLPAGQSIAQFVQMPIYPNGPSFSFYTNVLNWPQSVPSIEQYAMRFTGLYVATETGTHQFDPAHDDEVRLTIYTGDTPASSSNQFGAACCTGLTGGPTLAVDMVAGQSYFYELIVREFTGGDYAGIAVTMPSGRTAVPISSDLMAIASDPANTPNAGISVQPQNQTNSANHTVTFSVTVTNAGGAVAYQWQRNAGTGFTNVPGALNASYTTPYLPLSASGDQYRVIASVPGRVLTSASATSVITNDASRPLVLRGSGNRNLNQVIVRFNEALDIIGATNIGNYLITNTATGAALAINSATLSADLTTVTLSTGPQTPNGIYGLRVQNVADLAGNVITTTNITFQVWILSPGFVLKELYLNLGGGTTIGDLTNATKYPSAPDIVRYGTLAELNEADEFDNYGSRLSAVITPPVNGNYVFYLATDDPGELWLSTDINPANRILVAREPTWANRRDWTNVISGGSGQNRGTTNTLFYGGPQANITGPIGLVAGQQYYIESIMKEGGGGDNNGFTWLIPGGPPVIPTTTRGIGGYNVIAALADPNGASVTVTQQPASVTVGVGSNATLSARAAGVLADGSAAPLLYQWQRNVGGTFTDIAGAAGSNYVTGALTAGDSGSQFRVLVFSPGASTTSSVATVTVGVTPAGPTLRMSRTGGTLNFSWDPGARLQYTLSLTPPIVWKDIDTGGATNYSVVVSNQFNVLLDALQEPPPRGTGSGSGTVTLSNNVLVVDVVYGGMSGNRNNSHFHAPAPRGVSTGVAYNTAGIDSATGANTNAGTIKGTIPLVDNAYNPPRTIAAQIQDLRDGLWYLNVHSTTFSGGEIRGQVEPGARFYRLVSP